MTDEELVRAFESTELAAADFSHRAHVRVAWWYVRHHPIGEAIDRFSRALRGFAAAHGATTKYHETITVAYMLLIAERVAESGPIDWPTFEVRHRDLFDTPSILARYYRDDTLRSDRARLGFVMPDRIADG